MTWQRHGNESTWWRRSCIVLLVLTNSMRSLWLQHTLPVQLWILKTQQKITSDPAKQHDTCLAGSAAFFADSNVSMSSIVVMQLLHHLCAKLVSKCHTAFFAFHMLPCQACNSWIICVQNLSAVSYTAISWGPHSSLKLSGLPRMWTDVAAYNACSQSGCFGTSGPQISANLALYAHWFTGMMSVCSNM